MIVGCPKEIKNEEYRVGMTPNGVKDFVRAGHKVIVEAGAGVGSGFADKEYKAAGAELAAMETEARRLAGGYERIEPDLLWVDASKRRGPYDKTLLLLLGQERGRMSAVLDNDNVTFAAAFDSGVNFLQAFGISGGMPTRVSIQRSKLPEALAALGVSPADTKRIVER